MSDVRVTVPNEADYVISTSTNLPLPVDGLGALIQVVAYAIKTTPGRCLFNEDYGMGIRDLLPSAPASITDQAARANVARGLMKIEEDIQIEQRTENLTSAEQLRKLELVNLEFDQVNMIWEVTVRLTSAAGRSARVTLTV
jgi:phage baseplate assembly protein W